jgi:RNA polymerase sigma-70 factor (ECF subfamily)
MLKLPRQAYFRVMEDKLLIWKLKRGHREALRRVYEKYHVDLLKLAIALTGDVHVAEDIVHDVFVRFAQSIDRLSVTGRVKGYLVVSIVNAVRSRRRSRQRRREQSLDGAAALASTMGRPDQWAILGERLERLRLAMAQLPYEQREVIALHMQAGMTFRTIACRQNTSVSTVQGRYRYGIDKLRSLLNGEVSS